MTSRSHIIQHEAFVVPRDADIVRPLTVAVVEKFGKFNDALEPGCHCMPWCCGYKVAGELSLVIQQLDVHCETTTMENAFVNVIASIQYCISSEIVTDAQNRKSKARAAFYAIDNPKKYIEIRAIKAIQGNLRKVEVLNLDSWEEQKEELARAIEAALQKEMSSFGYEIVNVLIAGINFA